MSESKNVGTLVAKSTNNEEITPKDREYLQQLSKQIATTIKQSKCLCRDIKTRNT